MSESFIIPEKIAHPLSSIWVLAAAKKVIEMACAQFTEIHLSVCVAEIVTESCTVHIQQVVNIFNVLRAEYNVGSIASVQAHSIQPLLLLRKRGDRSEKSL